MTRLSRDQSLRRLGTGRRCRLRFLLPSNTATHRIELDEDIFEIESPRVLNMKEWARSRLVENRLPHRAWASDVHIVMTR